MGRGAILLVALLTVTAGCLSGAEDAASPPSANDTPNQPMPPADQQDNETEAEEDLPPESLSLYLHPSGTFVLEEPPEGEPARVPMPAFYPNFFTGFEPPSWTGGGPPWDVIVERVTVTFYYTQETPGQQDPNFPPFAAWWGHRDGTKTFSWMDGPSSIQPGEVVEASGELPVPPGGLVIPAGTADQLMVAVGYQPSVEGATNGEVLLWSQQTPSRVDVELAPFEAEPFTRSELLRESGQLEGGDCFGVEGPNTVVEFPFEVPASAVGLEAVLTRTGGSGQEDLDIDLYGPAGELIAGGHTPTGDEVVILYRPNMEAVGPGSWTAEINACGMQQANFELVVTLFEPAAG